jgi:hypothetical protein
VKGLDTDEAIAAKFRVNAARALPIDAVDAALLAWTDLATSLDVRQVISTVSAGERAPYDCSLTIDEKKE